MNLVPVKHLLIGRPDQIAAVLRAARARGHLLSMSAAEPLPGRKVAITITLLQPPITAMRRQARRDRWGKVWRIARPALITALGVAVLSGVGWLVLAAYHWASAHWGFVIVAGLVLLFGTGAVMAVNEESRR